MKPMRRFAVYENMLNQLYEIGVIVGQSQGAPKHVLRDMENEAGIIKQMCRGHEIPDVANDPVKGVVTFKCPSCGIESYNPNDIQNKYCGVCLGFFDHGM